jgi:hypothetical protein
LKDIRLRFDDDFYFVIPWKAYLLPGEMFDMPGFCIFGVYGGVPDDQPYILGTVFLKEYYMIYDYDYLRVGLALHSQSKSSIAEKSHAWIVWLVVIILLLVGVGIGYYCYK